MNIRLSLAATFICVAVAAPTSGAQNADEPDPWLILDTDVAPMSAQVRQSVLGMSVGMGDLFSATMAGFEGAKRAAMESGRTGDALAADCTLKQLQMLKDVAVGKRVIFHSRSQTLLLLNRNGFALVENPLKEFGIEIPSQGWCSGGRYPILATALTEERWRTEKMTPISTGEWRGALRTEPGTIILRGLKTFPARVEGRAPAPATQQASPREAIHPIDGASMLLIPKGRFRFGQAGFPVLGRETAEYWIDKYPVTNERYSKFVHATGHAPPKYWGGATPPKDLLQHPVVEVTYFDAKAYCDWAKKRLPTAEEWEKAARGDRDGRLFPWGDEAPPRAEIKFYVHVGASAAAVGAHVKGASLFGVHDMLGNVQEWTSSPLIPGFPLDEAVLVRGGTWADGEAIPISGPEGGLVRGFAPSAASTGRGFRTVSDGF